MVCFKPLLSQNPLKITTGTQSFTLSNIVLVNKHYDVVKDISDANGFKLWAQIALKLDASPKHSLK